MNAICWWQLAATNAGSEPVAQRRFDLALAGLGIAEQRDREAVQAVRLGTQAALSSELRSRVRTRRSLGSACAGIAHGDVVRRLRQENRGLLLGVAWRSLRSSDSLRASIELMVCGLSGGPASVSRNSKKSITALLRRAAPAPGRADGGPRSPARASRRGRRRSPSTASAPAATVARWRRVNLAMRYASVSAPCAHRLVREIAAQVLGERIDSRDSARPGSSSRPWRRCCRGPRAAAAEACRASPSDTPRSRQSVCGGKVRVEATASESRGAGVSTIVFTSSAGERAGRARGVLSAEQHVEQDAERVHVGGDRHRLAEELLGRGVLRRQGTPAFARELGRLARRSAFLEQLGDAEVEQLDAAVLCDQDVGRLDVAMDDEVGVRVRHRGEDVEEEPHPRRDVESSRCRSERSMRSPSTYSRTRNGWPAPDTPASNRRAM